MRAVRPSHEQDEMQPLLTPQFDVCAAMSASLRDANTSQSVIDIFDGLERLLGLEVFRSVFPVLLTDNGTEFSNPGAIERSVDGDSVRTRVFYCDPYAAWQKPNLKNNHRNLRRILPKGESMDFLTQEKVNLPLPHEQRDQGVAGERHRRQKGRPMPRGRCP